MPCRVLSVAVFAFTLAGAALAQAPAVQYRRSSGDTLRYREVTNASVRIQVPQRPTAVAITTLHDADVAVAFAGAGRDTAIAWYEELTVAQDGPQGNQLPSTSGVRGLQFVLHFTALGHVRPVFTPRFPAELAALTDLTQQFNDFFITLPAGRTTLNAGTQWADTTLRTEPGRPGDTFREERLRRYRVRGDTTVGGRAAVVIEVSQEMRIVAASPLEGGGRAATELQGADTGIAIFSVPSGRLIERHRSGRLTGRLTVTQAGASQELPQTYEYTSSLTLR